MNHQKKLFNILALLIVVLLVIIGCGNGNTKGETQSLTITVTSGGYSPQLPELKKGIPATLNFDAASILGCAGDLEIPQFGIRQTLVAGEITPITIVPDQKGDLLIRCSMNMFTATIKVP